MNITSYFYIDIYTQICIGFPHNMHSGVFVSAKTMTSILQIKSDGIENIVTLVLVFQYMKLNR